MARLAGIEFSKQDIQEPQQDLHWVGFTRILLADHCNHDWMESNMCFTTISRAGAAWKWLRPAFDQKLSRTSFLSVDHFLQAPPQRP